MLHVTASPAAATPLPASAVHGPLTPAGYLRLRRKASGLSIERAAELMEPRAKYRASTRGLIRMLETDGNTARHVFTLDYLRKAYPLDPNVYFQLMHEPADRHPAVCRGCGCSEWDACEHQALGACSWAGPEICTRCTGGEQL